MTPARLGLGVFVTAVAGFVTGLLYEKMPLPLNVSVGIGIVYILPFCLVVWSSGFLRGWTYVAAPVVLLMAFVSATLGDYLAWRSGLWALSYSDYGSDDMGGLTQLWWRLWFSLLTAIGLGLVVAFVAPAIRRRVIAG